MDKLTTTVIVVTIRDLEDIVSEHGCVCNIWSWSLTNDPLQKHNPHLSAARRDGAGALPRRLLYGSCHRCWLAVGPRGHRRNPQADRCWGSGAHAAASHRTHQSVPALTGPKRNAWILLQTNNMEQTSVHSKTRWTQLKLLQISFVNWNKAEIK